jgi:hypothetical protein
MGVSNGDIVRIQLLYEYPGIRRARCVTHWEVSNVVGSSTDLTAIGTQVSSWLGPALGLPLSTVAFYAGCWTEIILGSPQASYRDSSFQATAGLFGDLFLQSWGTRIRFTDSLAPSSRPWLSWIVVPFLGQDAVLATPDAFLSPLAIAAGDALGALLLTPLTVFGAPGDSCDVAPGRWSRSTQTLSPWTACATDPRARSIKRRNFNWRELAFPT